MTEKNKKGKTSRRDNRFKKPPKSKQKTSQSLEGDMCTILKV